MTATRETRLAGRPATLLGASIVLLEFMAAVTTFVASTLLPVVVDSFDAGDRVGVLVSGSAIGLFLAMPLADHLIGVLGTTVTVCAGVVLIIAGDIVSATSSGPWIFAGGRLVAGFASGLLAVFGVSAAVRHLEDATRRTVIALSSAMWIIPGLIAPPLIVASEHLIGWRWTLVLPVPFVVLAQLIIFRSVPPRAPTARTRPTLRTLLVPAGVGCFLLVGNGVPGWLALIVAGVGFRSLMPPGTLRARPGPPAALLGLTCFGLGYFGASALLTLLFTDVYGTSLAVAGIVLGAASAAWGVASVAMARIRVLANVSPALSMSVVAICVGGTCLAGAAHISWLVGALCWLLSGVGVGFFYPSVYLVATTPTAGFTEERAAAAAISTESFGSLMGGAIGGVLVSTGGHGSGAADFVAAYLLLTTALAVAAVASYRLSTGQQPA